MPGWWLLATAPMAMNSHTVTTFLPQSKDFSMGQEEMTIAMICVSIFRRFWAGPILQTFLLWAGTHLENIRATTRHKRQADQIVPAWEQPKSLLIIPRWKRSNPRNHPMNMGKYTSTMDHMRFIQHAFSMFQGKKMDHSLIKQRQRKELVPWRASLKGQPCGIPWCCRKS